MKNTLIKETESAKKSPEGYVIVVESWNRAEKIVHDGFVYVKYNDLTFYKLKN